MAKIAEIKKRMETIEMIGSITNAMYLVSTAKLQKHQQRMTTLMEYEKLVSQHMAEVFAAFQYTDEASSHAFMRKPQEIKTVAYIVFSSSMGLCGSYNENIMRFLDKELTDHPAETANIYMVGKYGYNKARHRGIPIYKFIDPQNDIMRYSELRERIMNEVIQDYYDKKIDAIRIIYTKYINPLSQKVKIKQFLPFAEMDELLEDAKISFAPYTLFEPSREEVLNYMVPKNIKSMTYIHYLESQTSEEAIRRSAMDSANTNGNELHDMLQLKYNRERQANITQEMTEIVSGTEED